MDERTVSHGPEEAPGVPSTAGGNIETLGRQLAELELVDVTTFDGVCQTVGASDSEKVVTRLEEAGKLTPFQANRIREGSPNGLRFDEYVLIDKLGEGGMGEVYKAYNLMLGRTEAIKTIVHLEGSEAALLKRFEQEARVLARLEHPAIVPIYKVGNFQGTKYIAMKFVEGDDLRHKVKHANSSGQPIPVSTACQWIIDAAEALAYAHKQNVIHRDIKPGNLIISKSSQRLIVLDMGIARLADPDTKQQGEGLTAQSRSLGTPEFMPPEQWADARAVTPTADIYALGVTLFYLLAGRVPFQSSRMVDLMRAHATEPVPSVRKFRKGIPPEIDAIIAKAMAKHPEDRFATASELADSLRSFVDSTIAERTPITFPKAVTQTDLPNVGKTPSRRPLFLLASGIVGAAILAVAGWFLLAGKPAVQQADSNPVAVVDEPTIPDWLSQYQRDHAQDWPDLQELFVKAKSLASDEELLSPTLGQRALAKETSSRRQRRLHEDMEAWLRQHQREHALAWPTLESLRGAAAGIGALNLLESSEQVQALQRQLTTITEQMQQPLQNLRHGDFEDDWIRDVEAMLTKILGLTVTPPDPSWKFEARFVDEDGRPVSSIRTQQIVHPRFTSSRDAYVTIVTMDPWTLSVMPVVDKATANDVLLLAKDNFRFASPGKKRFYIFATPDPLVEVYIPPVFANEDRPIEQLFASKYVFERIIDSLATGQTMPGVPANRDIDSWTFKTVEIDVTE